MRDLREKLELPLTFALSPSSTNFHHGTASGVLHTPEQRGQHLRGVLQRLGAGADCRSQPLTDDVCLQGRRDAHGELREMLIPPPSDLFPVLIGINDRKMMET